MPCSHSGARIDRNPEITYSPTDGKAMVLELQDRLKSDEDLDTLYVPLDAAAGPKIPAPLFSATIVTYDRPKFPSIIRRLLRLVGRPVEGAHLSFDRVEFALISSKDFRTGILSTQQEHRDLHQVGAKNFPNKVYGEEVVKESSALASLEPNSHLKLHSDFLLIESKGQFRAYLLDQLPKNILPIQDRVHSTIPIAARNPKR